MWYAFMNRFTFKIWRFIDNLGTLVYVISQMPANVDLRRYWYKYTRSAIASHGLKTKSFMQKFFVKCLHNWLESSILLSTFAISIAKKLWFTKGIASFLDVMGEMTVSCNKTRQVLDVNNLHVPCICSLILQNNVSDDDSARSEGDGSDGEGGVDADPAPPIGVYDHVAPEVDNNKEKQVRIYVVQ